MVNASKSRFLNCPRLSPGVRLGCLPSPTTRITDMNEWENCGIIHSFPTRSYPFAFQKRWNNPQFSHAYHGYERVGKLWIIPPFLESERNNKIAVLCIYALSQSRCNIVLDAVDDLQE